MQQKFSTYKRVLGYIKPFWYILIIGLLATAIATLIEAGLTYLLKDFLDKGFINYDPEFVKLIPIILLIAISIRGVTHAIGSYCMTWVARKVITIFRQQLFNHLTVLPADYYNQNTSGQILSKILYDVEQTAHISADALTSLVQSIFLIIGFLAVMFIISWQLSLLFLLATPIIAIIVIYANTLIRKVSHSIQSSMGQVTQLAEEALENYTTVRIFGAQQYEKAKFAKATETSRKRDMKVALIKAINVASVQIVIAISIASVIYIAIKLTNTLDVSAGGFLAMIAAMLQLIKPMKNITSIIAVIQRGLAGADSVFQILDYKQEPDNNNQTLKKVKGEIVFKNIYFAYQDDQILKNINLTIKSGQNVALVGQSGSGKTTLANLLARFYICNQGQILLDNVDINKLSLQHLRQQIAVVNQRINLFNDSVYNNIAYGYNSLNNKVADKESVIKAAKMAHALEFIEKLPQGFDTKIGDKGVLLSGGQCQRIAIARAILKDAPILILDEATSALDTEAEKHIQAALESLIQNKTTLIIAHRLSTIEKADVIAVMANGQIVEQGTHRQLLAKNGYYAHLYNLQFGYENKNSTIMV